MDFKKLSRPMLSGLLLMLLLTVTIFQACKKSRSDIGATISKETGNKIFKEITASEFEEKMKAAITAKKKSFRNPAFLSSFYQQYDYEPIVVMKHLPGSGLKKAAAIISRAEEHGISPAVFGSEQLNKLVEKIYNKSEIKTLDEAYETLIALELSAGTALSDYSNAMQFGIVSPRRIFAQYYTATKRPDSISFRKPFETGDIVAFMDSIQPKSEAYKMLQTALREKAVAPGLSAEETNRILLVNMERLRWQNQPVEDKYVWVNIPDFSLQVVENGKPALQMKVCVGEGRNNNQAPSLVEYDEDDLKKDRPFNRETPQLKSMIHSVQVNPVWNIPESIATNEITKYAAKDPYYLANNNIDVFYQGKKVEDPETVDWSAAGTGKTYTFKQRPGEENSLGKIKFLFNNQSSVYLHDTPAKAAFNQSVRAVSHGCVRVEKPLELAQALFGAGEKFERIKKGMVSENPKAEDIALSTQIPVYLSYFTCWKDSNSGKLKFTKDVYGLDAVLYTHLNRI
ncbi:L,D-transpeptidase [Pedobacter chinensis]|uniref:L,D-transpeptidase n=1 Tax=Pedobacter chinensis TaxID=2282421 RepID=A0A369PUS7_9SPHI|nr:L,D-transpeptidase family protein [Pedobacter chinensis]RDC54396.1 L,D-transpeptidase [Pedobacter chinensis]